MYYIVFVLLAVGGLGIPAQVETSNVYYTVFVFLILGGLGFPMPEELPLIIGGMAAAKHMVSLEVMFLVCYAGVLIGDQTMYLFGHFFGQRLLRAGTQSPFLPSITEEKINEVREGLRKKRLLYLFVGRHLFFLRSVTFVVAGALRVPFLEFLIADAMAALFSVSLFMWLGWIVGDNLAPEVITHIAHKANFYLLLALAIGAFIYAFLIKRNKGKPGQLPREADLSDFNESSRSENE